MGRKGSKTATVKELQTAKALYAIGKTYNQVGKELKRDPKTIKKWLSEPETAKEVAALKVEVADLYDDLGQRILQSITDEDIKAVKLKDRVVSAGICTDKSRLLRDLSTQNIAIESHAKRIEDLWAGLIKKRPTNETKEIEGEIE